MAPQIIIPAKTFREWVISLSPQVKAAIITVGCTLILSTVAGFWQWSRYAKENIALKQDLAKAAAKVQELEFELTPFRTLALERFSKADAEALKKLADQMTALQKDYYEQLKTVAILSAQIDQLRESTAKSEQKLRGLQRTIPPEKKDDFLKLLGQLPKAKINVVCRGGNTESLRFSEEIAEAFKQCGFEVERDYGTWDMGRVGETISVNNITNAPACAGAIQRELLAFGFKVLATEDPSLPTNTVRIVIAAQRP